MSLFWTDQEIVGWQQSICSASVSFFLIPKRYSFHKGEEETTGLFFLVKVLATNEKRPPVIPSDKTRKSYHCIYCLFLHALCFLKIEQISRSYKICLLELQAVQSLSNGKKALGNRQNLSEKVF